MATNTYVALNKITLSTSASSVTFSSIPQTYTDLILIISGSMTVTSNTRLQLNGATTNYSSTTIVGNGTSASSSFFGAGSPSISNPTGIYIDTVSTGTGQFQYIVNIMNYTNTTTFKTTLSRFGAASTGTEATVGLYRSTSAITQATLLSNFASGSTFSLYGIKAE
jgi:hypothetical protein